jgi:hypothetical protein
VENAEFGEETTKSGWVGVNLGYLAGTDRGRDERAVMWADAFFAAIRCSEGHGVEI